MKSMGIGVFTSCSSHLIFRQGRCVTLLNIRELPYDRASSSHKVTQFDKTYYDSAKVGGMIRLWYSPPRLRGDMANSTVIALDSNMIWVVQDQNAHDLNKHTPTTTIHSYSFRKHMLPCYVLCFTYLFHAHVPELRNYSKVNCMPLRAWLCHHLGRE